MRTPAWQIAAWDKIGLSVDQWEHLSETLQYLGSSSGVIEQHGLRSGQTAWGANITESGDIGLAWDWREVRPGVVAMADPMTVLSNVVLLENGEPVAPSKQILHLNSAIFSLPWQNAARNP